MPAEELDAAGGDGAIGTLDPGAPPLPSDPSAAEVGTLESSGESEWLDRICPYLLSEDGSWRSTQPDPAHRCMAQDPPGTLPSAFQERYCLSERHVRCEMFKLAQSSRSAALEAEGVPVEQVRGARFRPAVRSVPLALGATRRAPGERSRARSRRPVIVAAAGTGGLAVVLIVVLALVGGGGPGGGILTSASPSAPATAVATATARLTLPPAPTPTRVPAASPEGSPAAGGGMRIISYEVQEDEGLIRIAETFGVTRRRILNANEGMRDQDPYVVPGSIIRVPVSSALSEDEIAAQPGFIEFIE